MAVEETWNYQEIPDFYDRVRAILNNISEASLPNKFIDYPEKAKYSELYVKSRVPNWMELDEFKFAMLESAIIYKTASLFQSLTSSKSIKRKKTPTLEVDYHAEKAIEFDGSSMEDMVNQLIDKINGYDGTDHSRFVVVS